MQKLLERPISAPKGRRSEALHIAVLAPPWFSVPPQRYGGTEAVVSLLVDGLVCAGHAVDVYAAGDSLTSARLISSFDHARSEELGRTEPELLHALSWVRRGERYDVISDHSGPLGLMLSNLTTAPFLHTVHCALEGETAQLYRSVCDLTPSAALVSLTQNHRSTAPDLPWMATIPNAVALAEHPCRTHAGGEYLFWLGRMSPDKGPVTAIEVARLVGMPLVLAGKLRDPAERSYFEQEVRPRLGGDISYIGEIGLADRVRVLHRARALLNPIAWEEPFGLVMIEAMACGVPVVATPRGSVPEIVSHGRTGWIASSKEGLAAAVVRSSEIDPRDCRAHVERSFSPERMVTRYVRALQGVTTASWPESGRTRDEAIPVRGRT
jgi:glycosyltransferase involved in cell wall biosynthesis